MPSVIVRWVNDSGPYIYYSYYSEPGVTFKEEPYCGELTEVCDQLGLAVRETVDVEQIVNQLESEVEQMNPEKFVESMEQLDVERVSPRDDLTFIEQISGARDKIRSKHKLLDSFVEEDEESIETSEEAPLNTSSDSELRTERKNEHRERVTRERGYDAHTGTVKELYEYQCAVCQLSLKAPTDAGGVTYLLEAAHIEPASEGGPDTPQNRVSLCPNHHWAFDNGWISLTDDYTILVKQAAEYEGYDQLSSFQGEEIDLPDDPELRPHPRFIEIHRSAHGFD